MDNLFKEKSAGVMREGIKINMEVYLGDLDNEYLVNLDATISSYDNYDEVSAETYNDYKIVCAKLELLTYLGYMDAEELVAMRQTAAEMRLKKLEGLEHEDGK